MGRAVVVAGILASLTLALGCAGVTVPSSQGPLSASRDAMVADVPVPQGFKMDLKRSFYTAPAAGAARIGTLTYTGRAEVPALVDFYRDTMPMSGWTLRKESSDFGSYVLHFDKGQENATVAITPYRFSTDVVVTLGRSPR